MNIFATKTQTKTIKTWEYFHFGKKTRKKNNVKRENLSYKE